MHDAFWDHYEDLVLHTVIPYQEKILNDQIPGIEKSHAMENFRIAAGKAEGEFYGMVFQDSDAAKWAEAAANASAVTDRAEDRKVFEEKLSSFTDLLKSAQEDDGYLDTYFQIREPDKKFTNLQEAHELYCMGHMIEAAVADYEATGRKDFLEVGEKIAGCLVRRFGKGKTRGIPGHPEIEIALLRLYHVTGNREYLALAKYFIDERGTKPDYFQEEAKHRTFTVWGMDPKDEVYLLNDRPVREMEHAEGHAVRALYLYTAMADLAAETGDPGLKQTCERLFDDIAGKQMYVTGGVGQTAQGEAFTTDYDLPNDTAYAETCASVALIFFARRMLQLDTDGRYGDVMERALYNGMLSGMQQDGERFFYVNPLEVDPRVDGKVKGYQHVLPKRPQWYACACCPPNVARLITSLPRYAYGENADTIFCHLYLGGTYTSKTLPHVVLKAESGCPWRGEVRYEILQNDDGRDFALAVRIPGYAKNVRIRRNGKRYTDGEVKNGYLYAGGVWKQGDTLEIRFDMSARKLYVNGNVRQDAGMVCFARGPIVYCLESCDNGEKLWNLALPEQKPVTEEIGTGVLGGAVLLRTQGVRFTPQEKELYSEDRPGEKLQSLVFIPYYLWGNREEGEMRVFVREIQ